MNATARTEPAIVRTERGLAIAGTRITLYDIIDHLQAGWPPKLILNWLPLTEAQLDVALAYIDEHYDEVQAEYQTVLQIARENREYWEERNRDRLAYIAKLPPKPGQEEIYAKLEVWKARMGLA
ncbi:MAG: DUF433 domain-containing protein [Spirulina sp.]